MAYRNRLVTPLYHFISCQKCSKLTPTKVKETIQKYYLETIIRYRNYKKIKNKILQFIKKTGTPLILIKDLEEKLIKKYYPPYYVPQKGDIDLWGKFKDFKKFREYISKIGYDPHGKRFDWPEYLLPVYKFYPTDKKSYLPQIDFRYHSLIIPSFKINIMDKNDTIRLTDEIWKNTISKQNDFTRLSIKYLFLHSCLIYYFEDICKGLNNLYRIWILLYAKRREYTKEEINTLTQKYHINHVFNFVLSLVERSFPKKKEQVIINFYVKLALTLMDFRFTCLVYNPQKKYNFWTLSRGWHIHSLTRGLLSNESLWRKFVFLIHPKRVANFILGLFTE